MEDHRPLQAGPVQVFKWKVMLLGVQGSSSVLVQVMNAVMAQGLHWPAPCPKYRVVPGEHNHYHLSVTSVTAHWGKSADWAVRIFTCVTKVWEKICLFDVGRVCLF